MYESEGIYTCTTFLYCTVRTVRSNEAKPIHEQKKTKIKKKQICFTSYPAYFILIYFLFFILKSVGATANYKNQLLYRNKAKGQYISYSVKWTGREKLLLLSLIS